MPLSPHGEVEIDVADGTLRVVAAPVDRLELRGRLGADVSSLELTRVGRYVLLRTQPADAAPAHPIDLSSELEVIVPNAHDLVIRSHGADLFVSASTRSVSVRSVSGQIRVEGQPRRVEAHSVSGPIHLQVSTPEASARSVSGEMRISGRIEVLEAETVDVPLTVDAGIGVEGWLRTVTGRIKYHGELADTARLRAEASSGEVVLDLPADIEASFVLETVTGLLSLDALFPRHSAELGAAGAGAKPAGRQRRAFTIGTSPRRIEVSTISGPVHLRPQLPGEAGAGEGAPR
ncbi:MAG: DUF4097 domain-containing protein [Holophagales bacterium]|nr:DUF4097 domain-containing protein [Holophagales bacterium]